MQMHSMLSVESPGTDGSDRSEIAQSIEMTGRDCTWQLLASREEVALVGLAVDDDADDVQRK